MHKTHRMHWTHGQDNDSENTEHINTLFTKIKTLSNVQ